MSKNNTQVKTVCYSFPDLFRNTRNFSLFLSILYYTLKFFRLCNKIRLIYVANINQLCIFDIKEIGF